MESLRPPRYGAILDVCASLLATLLFTLVANQARAQQFTEIDPGLPKSANPCVVWGDYDNDGDLDVLVAGSGSHDIAFSTIYRNTGGTFTDSGVILLGLARATAAWGDFDGDGDLDLAMTGLTTAGVVTTVVYRNGGATFTAVAGSFLGVFAGNLAWGDYDGDGDLDLLVTGVTSSTPGAPASTRLYRNDLGVFTSVAHPFPNCYLGSLAWGDYNKDGRLDVVIAGVSETSALFASVWRNDGGGAFTDAGASLPGMDLGFAAWGDYDNDGDLDLLFGGNSNDGFITRVYRNDGGSFTDTHAGLLGVLWASAAWGDYDNDGDLDIMVIGYDAVAQVPRSILYRNDAGTFVDSGNTFHNLYLGTLSWIDYDNDRDLDLMLAGNSAGIDILSIYRNNSAAVNAPPSAPTNLLMNVIGTSATFSWSAASDDHTPSGALSYNLRVGTSSGGSEIFSPMADPTSGYRRVAQWGNTQERTSWTISLPSVNTVYWSVQAVDGAFVGSPFATEQQQTMGVSDDLRVHETALLEIFPNPTVGTTSVHYSLAREGDVRLEVFDPAGRRIWHAELDGASEGPHVADWDGRTDTGERVGSGIYHMRLTAGEESWSKSVVVLR